MITYKIKTFLKKVFFQVNQVLEKYSSAVNKPVKPQNGAILFSVVGPWI